MVTFSVRIDVSPGDGGYVEVDGSIPHSYPNNRTYTSGTSIRLEAIPEIGYRFANWSGNLTGSENPARVSVTRNKTITANFLPEAKEFTSEDEMLNVFIPEGTVAWDEGGDSLTSLEFIVDDIPPPSPPEANIVGPAYDLGPHGANFDQLISITWRYDPADVPPRVAEEDLALAYYDEDAGEWVELSSVVDTVDSTITAFVYHFTTFAIIAHEPPLIPAAFDSGSLSISPLEINSGETVTISFLVTNTGEEEGSYTITLEINGVIEETREITRASGSETVTFTTVKNEAGTYSVDVNGLHGSFIVDEAPPLSVPPPSAPPPTTVTGVKWAIFGPILALIIFLIIFLPIRLIRRRTF